MGTGGLDNCKVCHGPEASSTDHRVNTSTPFRNLLFDAIAKTGGLSPQYKDTNPNMWTCSLTYCLV